MPHSFPHLYEATASAAQPGTLPVALASPGLPELQTAPPVQFGGSGTQWSPETLLVAALANCFVFTFRAVSAASMFGWLRIECRTEGKLERVDGVPRFSQFTTQAVLTLSPGADVRKATRLLKKAGRQCMIANSLRGSHTLAVRVITEAA
jgi:organic hydroperoxide reductase OsmC/OhrA